MVAALGGPDDFLEHSARYLAHAPVIRPCNAERSGHVVGMDARQVGIAVVALGGGRAHADDAIDPSVGLTDVIDVGTAVRAGSPLCIVHAASDADADQAIEILQRAIRIEDGAPAERPIDHRSDRPMKLDLAAYDRDGFLVLKDFLPAADCDALQARAGELVAAFDPGPARTVFSTRDQGHARDRYFQESGGAIRFFFEEEATDQPVPLALNKIGHALHDLDPVFDRISRQPQPGRAGAGAGLRAAAAAAVDVPLQAAAYRRRGRLAPGRDLPAHAAVDRDGLLDRPRRCRSRQWLPDGAAGRPSRAPAPALPPRRRRPWSPTRSMPRPGPRRRRWRWRRRAARWSCCTGCCRMPARPTGRPGRGMPMPCT